MGDRKDWQSVNAMCGEVYGRLFGTVQAELPQTDDYRVWAKAAAFFNARIQGPEDWQECDSVHQNRKSDMSLPAKKALRAMLGQLEAACMLMSNRERVVQDIMNPGPNGLGGGELTQLELKRVDRKYEGSVEKIVKTVCSRLLGGRAAGPSTQEEAIAWIQAAAFLSGRIQASTTSCPGRAPDMSVHAATDEKGVGTN